MKGIVLAPTDPTELALMPEPVALDRNPAAVYIGSLGSDGSRRVMKDALRVAVEFFTSSSILKEERDAAVLAFPWHALRYQHAARLRAALMPLYAPASANRMLVAVKQVVNEARKLGLIPADEALLVKDLKPVKGERAPKGRALTAEEITAMRRACDAGPPQVAARDRFLVDLLVYGGLRREEASTLKLSSVRADELRVDGKGNKQRIVPVSGSLRKSLDVWLRTRGPVPGPLLYRSNREGELMPGRPTTGSAIFSRVRKLARAAAIDPVGPHDFRRTFASTLLSRGVDIKTVSRLLGHSSVATTEQYDRRPFEAARAAVEKLEY